MKFIIIAGALATVCAFSFPDQQDPDKWSRRLERSRKLAEIARVADHEVGFVHVLEAEAQRWLAEAKK